MSTSASQKQAVRNGWISGWLSRLNADKLSTILDIHPSFDIWSRKLPLCSALGLVLGPQSFKAYTFPPQSNGCRRCHCDDLARYVDIRSDPWASTPRMCRGFCLDHWSRCSCRRCRPREHWPSSRILEHGYDGRNVSRGHLQFGVVNKAC